MAKVADAIGDATESTRYDVPFFRLPEEWFRGRRRGTDA